MIRSLKIWIFWDTEWEYRPASGNWKRRNLLVFHFTFKGHLRVPCDRCAEPFDLPVEGNDRLILKFGTDYHEEDEEIQVVPVGENHFDISPFIYEFIQLSSLSERFIPIMKTGKAHAILRLSEGWKTLKGRPNLIQDGKYCPSWRRNLKP